MGYKLFLDDIRNVPMVYPDLKNSDFIVVRTFDGFVEHILKHGLPDFISFDNDLGEDASGNLLPDGYACTKWLVYESGLDIRSLKFKVHSANPVASKQISGLLTNYINHLKNNKR